MQPKHRDVPNAAYPDVFCVYERSCIKTIIPIELITAPILCPKMQKAQKNASKGRKKQRVYRPCKKIFGFEWL